MYFKCFSSLYLILFTWRSEDTTQHLRCLLCWFLRSTLYETHLLHTFFQMMQRCYLIAPGTELVTASSREIKGNVCEWFPYWKPVDFILVKSTSWNNRGLVAVIWISAQHLDWHSFLMTFPYLLNTVDGYCTYF